MNTFLGREGYVLIKKGNILPDSFLNEIHNDLVVSPIDNGYVIPKKFRLYTTNRRGDYILPKFYGIEKIGPPAKERYDYGKMKDFVFSGKLRVSQRPVIKAIFNAFNTIGGGIISMATGGGKTIMSLYCIYKLKLKTIIIVHRVELVKYWKKEIAKFVPNAEIGEIRGDIFNVEGKDIVVAMINTVSMKNYKAETFYQFDFLVIDECHSVASEIFHQCMTKIRPPYTLGLSATPERSDGLMKVVKWFIGDIVFMSKEKINSELDVIVNTLKYRGPKKYSTELIAFNQKPNIAKMMNIMCENKERNEVILHMIKELYKDPKRNVLVLADRKALLKWLKKELDKYEMSCDLFIGNMKDCEYQRAKKKRIILGSYQICGTGFNLPKLNSLVMATPRKKIEQMVGRILRKQHDINPVVIDVWDAFSLFNYMGKARQRFYVDIPKIKLETLTFSEGEVVNNLELVTSYNA